MGRFPIILAVLFLLTACGRSYQSATVPEDLSPKQKVEMLGSADGRGYRFERKSENHRGEPIELLEPVFSVDPETGDIRASVLWQYKSGPHVARKRIQLRGRFDDYTRSVILLPTESNERGALVKGHAFCPATRNRSATECETVVVDFYYVNHEGQLIPAQFEKTISMDLAQLQEEIQAEITPTPTPAAAEPPSQGGPERESEAVAEEPSESDDLIHDHEMNLPPGDVQSPTIEDESFYRGWLKPNAPTAQNSQPVAPAEGKPQASTQSPSPIDQSTHLQAVPTEAINLSADASVRERLTSPDLRSNLQVRPTATSNERSSPPVIGRRGSELPASGSSGASAADEDESEVSEPETQPEIDGTREDFDPNQVIALHGREDLPIFTQLGINLSTDTRQAHGHYANGRLERAVLLPDSAVGLQRVQSRDPDSYGTSLLVKTILHFAEFTKNELGTHLRVDDLSRRNGGRSYPHVSHQNGLDADVSFLMGRRGFDAEKNWKLMKAMHDTGLVSTFFVNATRRNQLCAYGRSRGLLSSNQSFTKKLYSVGGHQRHFHVRLHCTALNSGTCRDDVQFSSARACR